jgi:1-acyl-sn-glycerol-3-phosphate acyltransferase
MLMFLPAWLKGSLAALFFGLNTLFWTCSLYVFAVLKLLIPVPAIRRLCSRAMIWIAETWISGNGLDMALFHRIRWDVEGLDELRADRSYLVCANHQAWTDIVVLQKIFNKRIPFLRFFLKRELLYVPLLGLAWWALDFPFMRRYTKAQIAKDPRRRGQDLEATRRACERFRGSPVAVLNFLEGTRFSQEKHRRQASPYRNLLAPKTGGLAFVIGSMGDQFDALLDVTIFYPQGPANLWGLFSGKIDEVVVRVRRCPIPPELLGGRYQEDSEYRIRLQAWVRSIWEQKDRLVEELKAGARELAGPQETRA